MPNLRRYTSPEIMALADGIRQRLADRLLPEWGLRNLLEDFRFRDEQGESWAFGPVTRKWYRARDGRWSARSAPPGATLEGLADLRLFGSHSPAKPPDPEDEARTGKVPPAGSDPVNYLKQAVERIAARYADGRLTSDAAESLLAGVFLVDQAGTVWAIGVRSRKLHVFTGDGWRRDDGPPMLAAGGGKGTRPKHCSNCGAALPPTGNFCPNCGTPVPTAANPETDAQTAAKLSAFLTSKVDAFPESIVEEWAHAAGQPERIHNCPHCQAINVGEVDVCVSCKRPLQLDAQPAPQVAASETAARPPERAPANPPPVQRAAPAAARTSDRRWVYIGAASCLLIACACATLLLALGLMGELPGVSLPLDGAPQASQPADVPALEAPHQEIPTTRFALEDTFNDPTRTAVPLFGPDLMEFEVDADAGMAVMTAHDHGVLAAMYDSPVIGDFVATLELRPLDPAPGAGYGLIFRSDDAFDGLAHYYVALAAPADEEVTLTRWDANGAAQLVRSPYAPDPGGFIQMTVLADGSRLDIEINGITIATVIDESALGPGIFGLAMYSPSPGDQLAFISLQVESRDG